jgi:undecaprenyl phosphate-alpha-L-ara4N flippase subunit ArnE
MDYLLALAAVFLVSLGQTLQKIGLGRPLPVGAGLRQRAMVIFRPTLLAGFALVALAAVLWLVVLSRLEVSLAYPFLSLGFVLVLLFSRFWLGERVPPLRWLGVALIVLGVGVVAST